MDSQGGYSILDIESFASRFYKDANGVPRPLLLTPYAYNVTFLALAAAGVSTQTINIAANADFVLLMLHHRATIAGAVQNVSTKTAPQVRVLITDSGSGEQFTNSAVDLENYSTNGNIINQLSYPRIISGRSSLTVQVTNFSAGDTYSTLDIMFDGVQVRAYS